MSEGEDVSDDEIQGPPAALLEQEEFDTITSIATSCPVCFDDVTTGPIKVCSPCGHLFHHECIGKWLAGQGAGNKKCPLCRTTIKHTIQPQIELQRRQLTKDNRVVSIDVSEKNIKLAQLTEENNALHDQLNLLKTSFRTCKSHLTETEDELMRIADAHSSLSEASESYQRDFQHLQSSNQTLSRRLSETIMQCETMEKKLSMVMKREKQLEDEKLQLQKEKIAHKKTVEDIKSYSDRRESIMKQEMLESRQSFTHEINRLKQLTRSKCEGNCKHVIENLEFERDAIEKELKMIKASKLSPRKRIVDDSFHTVAPGAYMKKRRIDMDKPIQVKGASSKPPGNSWIRVKTSNDTGNRVVVPDGMGNLFLAKPSLSRPKVHGRNIFDKSQYPR